MTDTDELQEFMAKRLDALNTSYAQVVTERNEAVALLISIRRILQQASKADFVSVYVKQIDKLLSSSSWLEAKVAAQDIRQEEL